jgi:hypothetical protein
MQSLATFTICCLLLFSSIAQAELTDGVKAWVDKIETYRAQSIKSYAAGSKKHGANKEYRRHAAERLATAKKVHTFDYPREFTAPALPPDPKIGDVGDSAAVLSVIDDNAMVVESLVTGLANQNIPSRDRRAQPRKVTSSLGIFLVKGVSTTGVADGSKPELPTALVVTGTEKLGGRTLLVVEPVDLEAIRKKADAYVKTRPKKPVSATRTN